MLSSRHVFIYCESWLMIKELLAPAGDLEAGYAAIFYGANAVYLGLQKFSARATAPNFTEAQLDEFVAFAHAKNVKVYVALNTLVQENECNDLIENLDICSRCHVDALILQDLGAARVVRERYPHLEMHASTQMAVHNREGALALKNFGFSRVVVARELSQKEIADIASLPDLEIEAFIHGALCYSYSGLCLFSSFETGKSANRGKCLYPCRACFSADDGEKHYFSMKDMALERDVLKMPAYSLKIEGRKKSALYVAAVTDFYRRLLDGKGADKNRADNIKQIFSRPWCQFHFNGKDKNVIDRDFVGHRGLLVARVEKITPHSIFFKTSHILARHDGLQIDVSGFEKPFGFSLLKLRVNGKNVVETREGDMVEVVLPPHAPKVQVGDKIYLASSSAVKGAYDFDKPKPAEFKNRTEIDIDVFVTPDKISAQALNFYAEVNGVFSPAQNVAKTSEAAQKAFAKTGDTALALRNLVVHNDNHLFVPASLFNDLRRDLFAKIQIPSYHGALPEIDAPRVKSSPRWIVKIDNPLVLEKINTDNLAEITFLLNEKSVPEDLKDLPFDKIRLALPAVCRHVKSFERVIAAFLNAGFKKWEIANYWGLSVLDCSSLDVSFDRQIYMLNTQALQAVKNLRASRATLSVEDNFDNLTRLAEKSPLPVALIVYADVELFTSAACIRSNDCNSCPRGEKWIALSRGNQKYMVLSRDCQTMVFDKRPFCIASEAQKISADFYRIDFLYKPYTPDEAKNIFDKVTDFSDVNESVLKGNLYRAL